MKLNYKTVSDHLEPQRVPYIQVLHFRGRKAKYVLNPTYPATPGEKAINAEKLFQDQRQIQDAPLMLAPPLTSIPFNSSQWRSRILYQAS